MDSIDFDNLTGTESLEELETALNMLEDGGDTESQDQIEQATHTEEKGEQTAPPAAEVQGKTAQDDNQEEGQEGAKVILSKDGKHQIPYDVLETERAQRQALAAENAQLKAEAGERERLQALLDKHGIKPDADMDALDVEEIEQLAQDYPEIGKVLTGIASRLNKLAQTALQQPAQSQAPAVPDEVQTALQAVPELATWMEKDQDRATFAVSVDERLKADPAWKDKSLTERFVEVTKRTKAAFGDLVEQQAPPADKPAPQKKVEERDHIPPSPSDLGQSVQHESKLEKYGGMSQEQLMAEMSNMSAAQIEALLAEHDL
ncbi:hypothetical protein [Aeromonas dhakensis]|uniref:hypothetical protein n=1 Tax=Aeromonas dhakensis TaxID=196024 RepID=UPI001F6077C0|nr:hypothetical protein [Aeromonas dhakensis]UNU87609.1 DUF2894 domain-containing protein [Aeromonas dhakensis]